jgi:2-oxoglutarate ferredoxin oxidoreductase subunit alpha
MAFSLMEGNEAVAWGAVTAGCRFFAGYPITPATTIFATMLNLLPPLGGICIQGEDEIASIGYCLGASMAGMKVMTATSGPGISLCSENISFAVGSEIPIVIVDVQRLGPSTGSATRGADGDIQFLRWGSSGGIPVIVLAPVDVKDCFYLSMEAFNLAEQFRCPVFIASNKEIAMTRESIDLDAIVRPQSKDREAPPPGRPFLPFQIDGDRMVPYFLPIGGNTLVRQTSSTHGPEGYITTDPNEISRTLNRLKMKLDTQVDAFCFYEFHGKPNAETLVLTYGITARAARVAFELLRDEGYSLSLLVLKTLWPVPRAFIREKAENAGRLVVVEMNLGQYVKEIERILPEKRIDFFGQMNGKLITPTQIREFVTRG